MEHLLAGAQRAAGLCLSVLPLMLAGCLAGSFFANSRLGERCDACFAPLARLARLEGPATLYVPLCFLSFHSANAYLATLLRRGLALEGNLLGMYLVGWLPASMNFYLFVAAPVLAPGIGLEATSLVLALYVLVSLLIFGAGVVLLRRGTAAASGRPASGTPGAGRPAWPGWGRASREGAMQFFSIASVFVPCIFAVEALLTVPAVRSLLEQSGGVLLRFGIPPAAALVTVAALPSVTGGFATAIACLGDLLLTPSQLPKVFMLAATGHALFSAFSYFLPANVAVFGPRLGVRLTFVSLAVRIPCLLTAFAIAWLLDA